MTRGEREFWQNYAQCLVKRSIVGHRAEWHMRRAQEFCYGLEGRRLAELKASDLEAYLDDLGRHEDLAAWQCAQSVSALQVLLCDAERFAHFCGGKIPDEHGKVTEFLEYLALKLKVAPATQAQALNALVFLYRRIKGVELGDLGHYQHPAKHRKLPVVLTHREVDDLLAAMPDTPGLMARMIYGTGMRLMECVGCGSRILTGATAISR